MTLDPNIPSSETIYSIPRNHHHCHLHNFEWNKVSLGERGKKTVETFLEEWREGGDPHLILVGQPGLGKTHIAIGIMRFCVYHTDLSNGVYVHVPDFCIKVKKSFNKNDFVDPFYRIENANLVVLDDIFGRELTQWESEHVIPRLISTAYDNAAALVVTTNYGKEGIQNRLHPHEASRLFANSKLLIFKGEDQR